MKSISTGNQSLVKLERKGGKLLIFDEYFKHLIFISEDCAIVMAMLMFQAG